MPYMLLTVVVGQVLYVARVSNNKVSATVVAAAANTCVMHVSWVLTVVMGLAVFNGWGWAARVPVYNFVYNRCVWRGSRQPQNHV